jgi:hypothetical protein
MLALAEKKDVVILDTSARFDKTFWMFRFLHGQQGSTLLSEPKTCSNGGETILMAG